MEQTGRNCKKYWEKPIRVVGKTSKLNKITVDTAEEQFISQEIFSECSPKFQRD